VYIAAIISASTSSLAHGSAEGAGCLVHTAKVPNC